MKIFVACPYGKRNGATPEELATNVALATICGADIFVRGHNPCIPNLYHYVDIVIGGDYEKQWSEIGLEWLGLCDAIFLAEGWRKSAGCRKEYEYAKKLGLKVYTKLNKIPREVK